MDPWKRGRPSKRGRPGRRPRKGKRGRPLPEGNHGGVSLQAVASPIKGIPAIRLGIRERPEDEHFDHSQGTH